MSLVWGSSWWRRLPREGGVLHRRGVSLQRHPLPIQLLLLLLL